MVHHDFGVFTHDWLSLHMEIPQHFVTPPTPNETDDISIHVVTEECHGAWRPKGLRRDIFVCESQMGSREEFDRGLEVGRDHSGAHVLPTAYRHHKTGNMGVQGGALLSEVSYSPPQCLLWA